MATLTRRQTVQCSFLSVGSRLDRSPGAIDAVMTTGDNTDNQSGTEYECLLSVLAGGTVFPDSGGDQFEGVAGSGLWEYWQPESTDLDRYKDAGFPTISGLLDAAMRPFVSPVLKVPWLLTMGNHDDTALGTLANRPYVDEWTAGARKIFSAGCDEMLFLAELASRPTALSDPQPEPREVADLLDTVARLGETRSVVPDERRRPFTGTEYVAALRSERFTGAGPVGHGYGPDADGSPTSHVDAPQQARVIEVASNGDGTVSVFTTMVDADAPVRPSYDDLTPENLAGIFREVAFNDLSFRDRRGSVGHRNAELLLRDPLAE